MADMSGILKTVGSVAGTAIGGPVGGMIGGAAGSMIGGQLGKGGQGGSQGGQAGGGQSQLGNIAGAALGVGQMIGAKRAKNRAEAATPAMVDPMQSSFLAELQQKRNALNTGAQYTSSIDAIRDRMSQTQDVISRNSGGDSGGTIAGLLKSQQVANRGAGEVMAQGQQQEGMYTGMYGDLMNKVAQRKLELGLLSRAQNMAEAAQGKQDGASNLMAGVARMGGGQQGQGAAPTGAANILGQFGGSQGVDGSNSGLKNKIFDSPMNTMTNTATV